MDKLTHLLLWAFLLCYICPVQVHSNGCPYDYPTPEFHIDANHGDVCRNENYSGLGIGWSCPGTCVGRNNAPWCMVSTSDTSPCRIENNYVQISASYFCEHANGGIPYRCYQTSFTNCKEECIQLYSCVGYSTGDNYCFLFPSDKSCPSGWSTGAGNVATNSIQLVSGHTSYSGYNCYRKVTDGERFETTAYGEICSDITKESVKSFDECKKAAIEMGYTLSISHEDDALIPKGCVLDYRGEGGIVIWNSREMKERNNRTKEICRNGESCGTICGKDGDPTWCDEGKKCHLIHDQCLNSCVPDLCEPNPCLNEGFCDDYDGTCSCKDGFYGVNCEHSGVCENAHGFFGFYYSHNGKWHDGKLMGWKSKVECANTCGPDCIAFSGVTDTQQYANCYHYYNKAQLVNENQHHVKQHKAYARCSDLCQDRLPYYFDTGNECPNEECPYFAREGWCENTWRETVGSNCGKKISHSGTKIKSLCQKSCDNCVNSPDEVLETVTCKCWGDPHCSRFDGSRYDEFRVGEFMLVQSNMSLNSTSKFRIRMKTFALGSARSVSEVSNIFLDLFDSVSGRLIATVELDQDGNSFFKNATTGVEDDLVDGITGNGFSFEFIKIRKWMRLLTDSGVEISMEKRDVTIRVPKKKYLDNVYDDGLCISNQVRKYDSVDNRQQIPNCEIEECEKLFDASWLASCKRSVSQQKVDELIAACKVDYCVNATMETKIELVRQLVSECREVNPIGDMVCDWEIMLTGQTPGCAENQFYKGCANGCDFLTCQDFEAGNTSCISDGQMTDGCVCNPGYFFLNGNCVNASVCEQPGWTAWSTWSGWHATENTRQRVKIFQVVGWKGKSVMYSIQHREGRRREVEGVSSNTMARSADKKYPPLCCYACYLCIMGGHDGTDICAYPCCSD